jgi:uncharacterized metal-binding protein YceD (DUF177 family)
MGLANKSYPYDFEIGDAFFAAFECDLVNKGNQLKAHVELIKSETMIRANLSVNGHVNLTCDRSLDEFDYPLSLQHTVFFKYGAAYEDHSDDVVIIPHTHPELDFGPILYDFVMLEIPVKKLHPRYQNQDYSDEDTLFYSTDPDLDTPKPKKEEPEDKTDSRWNILNKLKFD